jgi:purine-binding chemotaxis protein CheW
MPSEETILRQRAARFAQGAKTEQQEATSRDLIVFVRDGESYALVPSTVREVLAPKSITTLPGVPFHIAGLINLRSRVYAVVDIAALFGRSAAIDASRCKILIVTAAEKEFGLLADELIGLQSFEIGEGVAGSRSLDSKFLRGFLPDGRGVLDLAAVAESSLINQQI